MRNLGLMAGGLGVAAVLAAFGPQAAEAQDLSVISMETHAYPSLVNWHERDGRPCCHPETLATDGMVFLDVRGVFDVPWSDTVTRFSASSRDVTVTLPDGTQLNPVGSYDYYGMYHFTASSPSASRPNGWPSEDRDLIYQAIFEIPAGRWGRLDDLMGAAVFLASQASDYVNGWTISLDGGFTATV